MRLLREFFSKNISRSRIEPFGIFWWFNTWFSNSIFFQMQKLLTPLDHIMKNWFLKFKFSHIFLKNSNKNSSKLQPSKNRFKKLFLAKLSHLSAFIYTHISRPNFEVETFFIENFVSYLLKLKWFLWRKKKNEE